MTDIRDLGRAALAPAGLLLAGIVPAWAGDIPGNASTKATLQVTNVETEGVFDTITDSDWYRVQLTKGQDYAVTSSNPGYYVSLMSLRSATGKPLKTSGVSGVSDDGFEIRAPYTGTYFVEVKFWRVSDPLVRPPQPYYVAVVRDCKDGLDTRCRLVPGKTYHVGAAWRGDVDLYAAALDASKWYTFTGTVPDGSACGLYLQLLDRTGRVIVPFIAGEIKNYKPPQSGKYYLEANCNSEDFGGRYGILMTAR